jgi:hypothetical protein
MIKKIIKEIKEFWQLYALIALGLIYGIFIIGAIILLGSYPK